MSGDRSRAYRVRRALRVGLVLTLVSASIGGLMAGGCVLAFVSVAGQLAHKSVQWSPLTVAASTCAVVALLGLVGTAVGVVRSARAHDWRPIESEAFEFVRFTRGSP